MTEEDHIKDNLQEDDPLTSNRKSNPNNDITQTANKVAPIIQDSNNKPEKTPEPEKVAKIENILGLKKQNTYLAPTKEAMKEYKITPLEKGKLVSYGELFKYGNSKVKCAVVCAIFFSCMSGVAQGIMPKVLGDAGEDLGVKVGDDLLDAAKKIAIYCMVLGLLGTFLGAFGKYSWSYVNSTLDKQIRSNFFRAIMRQDCGWYDILSSDKITTLYNINGNAYTNSLGNSNSQIDFALGQCITSIILAFTTSFVFTFIMFLFLPLIFIGLITMSMSISKGASYSKQAYIEAGAISEQAISGIRTLKSLNGEERESELYKNANIKARDMLIKFGFYQGLSFGVLFLGIYLNYGVGLWAGGRLIEDSKTNLNFDRPYTVSDVLTTFFSVLTAFFSSGTIAPAIDKITKGREAAYEIYSIIESTPSIDEDLKDGIRPTEIHGDIEFKDVYFSYPSRPQIKILQGLNVTIPKGKKVAFVGETGCGKSTSVQLIERFYDPNAGNVYIDGENIKDYNLQSLRNFIGYVGQEPVLFAMSIEDNLKQAKPDATEEDIIRVQKQAEAWEFVNQMEDGIKTNAGLSGSTMSGGQKQRIAIARAMLQDPPILLLDESTSALDRKNEKLIQETLDQFAQDRTTIYIAHRQMTIRNADIIFVLKHGKVLEQGTHDEQMKSEGNDSMLYWKLVKQQQVQLDAENVDGHEDDHHETATKGHSYHNMYSYEEKKSAASIMFKAVGKHYKDKELKEARLKNEAYSKYQHDCENSNLRELESQDSFTFNDKQNKVNSTNHFVPGNVYSRSNAENTSSIIPKRHLHDEETKKTAKVPYEKLWADLYGDRTVQICAWIAAMALGCLEPLIGYYFGGIQESQAALQISAAMNIPNPKAREDLDNNLYRFLAMAFGALIASTLESGGNSYVGQKLTTKLRNKFFVKLLNHDIEFFDDPAHSPGQIAASLEEDTNHQNSLMTDIMGVMFKNGAMIALGIGLAFSSSWRMSLVVQAVIPLLVLSGVVQSKTHLAASGGSEALGGSIVQENVNNLKTVRAMNCTKFNLQRFDNELNSKAPSNLMLWTDAFLYGFGSSIILFLLGLLYYVGALFIKNGDLKYGNFQEALMSLVFAGMGMGQASQFAGDAGVAQESAIKIYAFLDSKQKTRDPKHPEKLDNFNGRIEFVDATFGYPGRTNNVYENMNLVIEGGSNCAFCGPSGSGKSTIIQLLMRFYDLKSGKIYLGGNADDKHSKTEIKMVTLKDLRNTFGLVGQEPFLFNLSIRENIVYNGSAGEDEVKDACVKANADAFIFSDNEKLEVDDKETLTGLDRFVGVKGSKLSGGQKQRVAIARAIVRQPKAYLFDEATSALDSKSEKLVQEALDKICVGKTAISIAHRLSTIKNCNPIFVINEKKVKEQGTFEELMAMKGVFYKLNHENAD